MIGTLIAVMIRINDFTIINLVHITPIGITHYNTKSHTRVNSRWNNPLQHKVTYKGFIDFVFRVNY